MNLDFGACSVLKWTLLRTQNHSKIGHLRTQMASFSSYLNFRLNAKRPFCARKWVILRSKVPFEIGHNAKRPFYARKWVILRSKVLSEILATTQKGPFACAKTLQKPSKCQKLPKW